MARAIWESGAEVTSPANTTGGALGAEVVLLGDECGDLDRILGLSHLIHALCEPVRVTGEEFTRGGG